MHTDKTSLRAFFAIDLPPDIKTLISQLIQELQKFYALDEVRWTEPNSLHITLQFMKQISRENLDKLIALVCPAISAIQPFEFTMGQPHLFPDPTLPKFIALDVQPQKPLHQVSKIIRAAMTIMALPIEKRPFRAHITLGRFNLPVANSIAVLPNTPLPATKLQEIIVFQSQPKPTKSHYKLLAHLPLNGQ